MKKVSFAFALSLLVATTVVSAKNSEFKNGDSGVPTLKGTKAFELMDVLDKTKAAEGSCSTDNCYKRGELDVSCKSPSGTKSDVSTSCSLRAFGKAAPEVSLNTERSKRMMNLLDAARATEDSPEPCSQMGTCHQKGSISVECQYPAGKNSEKEFSCAVSPVTKKTSPRVVSPEADGNR